MPDVIIKGMEMPSRCEDCFAYSHNAEYDYAYCNISSVNVLGHGNARLNNCPLRPAPEWISVEERLPIVNERVLACVNILGKPSVWDAVRWNGEEWEAEAEAMYDYWTTIDHPVTHWMPLPEVPE